MFTAGLAGIRDKEPLPDPVEENIYRMSNSRQKKHEIRTLPRDLEEALRIMEKSGLIRETLGEHLFDGFLANKRRELAEYANNVPGEYDKQVSDYEVRAYLPFL